MHSTKTTNVEPVINNALKRRVVGRHDGRISLSEVGHLAHVAPISSRVGFVLQHFQKRILIWSF